MPLPAPASTLRSLHSCGRASLLAIGPAVLAILAAPAPAASAPAPITIAVEAEQFEFPGDWTVVDYPQTSGGKCLLSGTQLALPAATAVTLPTPGRYHLWVRAMDFPKDRPGTRRFSATVGGRPASRQFGASQQPGFVWEDGGAFDLPAGQVLLTLKPETGYARADAILLTTDPKFRPTAVLGTIGRHRRAAPDLLVPDRENDPLAAQPVAWQGDRAAASLENEYLRLAFLPARRHGTATVAPRVSLRTTAGWSEVAADPGAEIYAVIDAGPDATLHQGGFFPRWQSGRFQNPRVTLRVGDSTVETKRAGERVIWQAGRLERFLPRTTVADGSRVRLEFHPSPLGALQAEWELRPGERAARVRLTFTPAAAGQYAVGYHLFFRRPIAEVPEILLPMMWHRQRLPEQPRTLLDPFTPTPLALAQTAGARGPLAWAIAGEPTEIPFAWPQPSQPHFGLAIRDHAGAVQPSIHGPVPGTPAAHRAAGQPLTFAFRVLVQPGDWYAGFRTVADDIFGLRDYRRNVGTSLTAAALNMIDLLQDDRAGGWWGRGKGFYQIETKNGVTHASPLTLLSVYRLTGDAALYSRRVRPTLEYVLSRRSPHFSPLPHDTGRYEPGGMDGPVKLYGTTTLGGLWELTGRHTPAFGDFALPADTVRPTAGYSHAQAFDDWLSRFELTGDPAALARARTLADDYLARQITQPPRQEIGPVPFFFITFVPGWEGLLRLFEATGERRYLDAAAFGARQLMTGLWTQPSIPAGDITIHPGGVFKGDTLPSWRGDRPYRLGTPRRAGDTPERRVPAWVVSNVGLGFEQPSTYKGSGPGRLIFQMGWAADFLRLAHHTGDRAFETCARNAVLGRWANYPGYYATGFTDLPLNPRYPYEGPDVTDFYYHHIAPHLAWTLDYLVATAELRSGGRIAFPSQRQNGYAYFDSRVYGHRPGTVLGHEGAWLWLRRDLVAIDNPQLDFLTAHSGDAFFLILLNESDRAEAATVRLSATALGLPADATLRATRVPTGDAARPAASAVSVTPATPACRHRARPRPAGLADQ
jgi:hypothetical protein